MLDQENECVDCRECKERIKWSRLLSPRRVMMLYLWLLIALISFGVVVAQLAWEDRLSGAARNGLSVLSVLGLVYILGYSYSLFIHGYAADYCRYIWANVVGSYVWTAITTDGRFHVHDNGIYWQNPDWPEWFGKTAAGQEFHLDERSVLKVKLGGWNKKPGQVIGHAREYWRVLSVAQGQLLLGDLGSGVIGMGNYKVGWKLAVEIINGWHGCGELTGRARTADFFGLAFALAERELLADKERVGKSLHGKRMRDYANRVLNSQEAGPMTDGWRQRVKKEENPEGLKDLWLATEDTVKQHSSL